jgi:hypothetical protein
MGVIITEESALGQEMAKWEQFHTKYGPPGNPYRYQEYPRMLYKAQKRPDGKVLCMDSAPHRYAFLDDATYMRAVDAAEVFTRQCQRIVNSDSERADAEREGWCVTAQAALEYHEKLEQAIGDAAAHRAYEDRLMSDRAKAEAKAADDATHEHVPEVPRTPIRRGKAD